MPASRKQLAVSRLEQIVRKLFRMEETGLSGLQHGRLAVDLRRSVLRLRRLAQDDPEEQFWDALQKVMLKAIKYLRRA
jgi:hypothetical protein